LDNVNELAPAGTSSLDIKAWRQSCYDAMNDDFNSPILIAQLFEAVKYINLVKDSKETLNGDDIATLASTLNSFVFDVLGLENAGQDNNDNGKLEGIVNMLINMRNEARANKDFALSDQIRNKLTELGIELKDTKEGTTFSLHS
jgi:cysteinyl-tRNA synthetase